MDEDLDFEERRDFPRFQHELTVSYTLLSSMDATPFEYGQTVTKDISQSGVCLFSDEEVQVPVLIQMNIQIPTRKYGIIVLGKTLWCRYDESRGKYQVGIKFVGLLPPDLANIIESTKRK